MYQRIALQGQAEGFFANFILSLPGVIEEE